MQIRQTKHSAALLALVVALVGCSPSWSETDLENAAHFFRAFDYANDAAQLSNSAGAFSLVPPEQVRKEIALLAQALEEAERIDDSFLDERHHDFRRAFRELFQKSIQLRVEGLQGSSASSLKSVSLYGEWIDWFEQHKREMTLPRPSEVLTDAGKDQGGPMMTFAASAICLFIVPLISPLAGFPWLLVIRMCGLIGKQPMVTEDGEIRRHREWYWHVCEFLHGLAASCLAWLVFSAMVGSWPWWVLVVLGVKPVCEFFARHEDHLMTAHFVGLIVGFEAIG